MVTSYLPHVGTRPAITYPRVSLQFRLLREGEVTAGVKFLRVARALENISSPAMVFKTEDGETTQTYSVDLATLLAQGEWLAMGTDDAAPRKIRMTYLSLTESGTFTFNITNGEGGGGGVDGYTLRSGDRLLVIDAAGTVVGLTPTP